jgi:hypothetical protein
VNELEAVNCALPAEMLVHYGPAPLGPLSRHIQSRPQLKPKGLWVSVDSCENNWRDWCEGAQFRLNNLQCAQQIILQNNANILRMASPYELDNFTSSYDITKSNSDCYRSDYYRIDWIRVAEHYDGLIIAPYVWQRRLELMWYYCWDCASGCIWNPDAIARVCDQQEAGPNP